MAADYRVPISSFRPTPMPASILFWGGNTFAVRKAKRREYFERWQRGWRLGKCGACSGSGAYASGRCGACGGDGRERKPPVAL